MQPLFSTGGVFVIVPIIIGPKELHRRISRSKPVCVVTAPCDQVNSEFLDVVDQVRDKQLYLFNNAVAYRGLYCRVVIRRVIRLVFV